MAKLVRCYNKGCGKEFDPENTTDDACVYHPGAPVFHDAKKKWSCCNKYSTDFSEFLSMKGCTSGPHNAEKPKNAQKPVREVEVPTPLPKPVPKSQPPPPSKAPLPRPALDEKLVALPVNVAASLKTALEKLKNATPSADSEASGDQGNGNIKISTHCHNKGCKATYHGPDSNSEICLYHPGVAIFHEGMKFWSCCQRKTTEFDSFLEQEGCTSGRHNWTKEEAAATNMMLSPTFTECRFDWFQLPDSVNISVYAKNTLPETVKVQCNGVFLTIYFVYDAGNAHYDRSFNLLGIVDPSKSQVNLTATKLEVVLKKAEARAWSALETRPAKAATTEEKVDT
uniref:Cysteine and histidine-rich domain-containing protein 1 n=2 Tax=Schistocephalus solidus TaxID=70667 RepID=A0A0X3PTR2_SCHSO